MAKFQPTNGSNPCPICHKTNGNCRNPHEKLVLCRTFADAIGESINGYKFIGNTSDHGWGKFIEEDNNSDWDETRRKEYEAYKIAEEQARQEQFKGSLSVEERDKNIRIIIKTLGLTFEHRQELKGRGLTDEEIEKGKFCSIKPFSELPSSISTRLASIYIGQNGYPHIGSDFLQGILCPIFNQDDLIIGFQVMRTYRSQEDSSKYVWACTGEKKDPETKEIIRHKISSHLPNGELPINYHYVKDKNNQILYLNDGIIKTYIAYCVHDIDIVGCAGGNFSASINQLLEIIKFRDYETIVYTLDGGDILNRSVIKRLEYLAKVLKEHGINLKFTWWGQVTKDSPDIDELERLAYEYLGIDELLELAKKEQWKAKNRAKLEQFINYHADITFNSRYVSDGMKKIDTKGKVTGIRANLNTGKTYWLYELLAEIAQETGQPVILIGSRQVLTCNSAKQLNITYCDKSIFPDEIQDLYNSENELDKRLAIVADSLLKLKDIDWSNAIVIIDEAEQFLEHLILAKTHIDKVRAKVLALLADKLPTVERIILLDGHLSDFTCDYFQKTSKLPLQKIENLYQENHRTARMFDDKDQLCGVLSNFTQQRQKNFIVSDSAKELTAMYQVDMEKGIKSVLLTRDSLSDNPNLHRFLENKGQAIRDEGIQNVYLSPVGQSGISIEVDDYFDNIFAFFFGAIGINTALQMLIRERSQGDRFIWANERGLGYTTDYDPEQIKETQEFKEISLIESIKYYQERLNLSFDDAHEHICYLRLVNKEVKDINQDARASLICRNNLMKSDFRFNLIDALKHSNYIIDDQFQNEGYGINYIDTSADIEIRKEKNDIEQSKRVNSAPDIDEQQAEILSNQDGLKQSERDKLLKYRIRQFLPNFELNSQFILRYFIKDRQWQKLKAVNNFFLALNPEICQKLDLNSLNFVLYQTQDNGIYWANDTKQHQPLNTIFEGLGLRELISKEFINETDLRSFVELCKKYRLQLRTFNIKFWDTGKIEDYHKLLKKVFWLFGFKPIKVSKKGEPNQWKINKVINDEQLHHDIYQSIVQKYSQEIELKYDAIHNFVNQNAESINNNIHRDNNFFSDVLNTNQEKIYHSDSYKSSTLADDEPKICNKQTFDDEVQINEDNKNEDNLTDFCLEDEPQPEPVQQPQPDKFVFNPIQIDSKFVGEIIKDILNETKQGIVRAVFEFKGRFYAHIHWLDSDEVQEFYGFSSHMKLCEVS